MRFPQHVGSIIDLSANEHAGTPAQTKWKIAPTMADICGGLHSVHMLAACDGVHHIIPINLFELSTAAH